MVSPVTMSFPYSATANTADTQYFQLQQIPERYDDSNKSSRVSAKAIPASHGIFGSVQLAEQDRRIRQEWQIRIAKGFMSLLTSLISLTVVYLQGNTWLTYQRTMHIEGAWPNEPNLSPTLVLLATGIIAVFIDIFALVAYMSPLIAMARKLYNVC